MRKLTDFKTGTVLPRGERLNEIQAAIRDLQNSRTSAPPRQQIVAECLGVITDKGPNGEQYATGQTSPDERHWVQLSYFKPANVWDQLKTNPDKLITPNIVYATCLSDLANHTHSLAKGTYVKAFAWTDRGTPPKLHWFVHGGVGNNPLLRVLATTWSDSTVLGQGVYRARIVTVNTTAIASFNPTTSPTDAGIFTSGTTDVLAINEADFGLSGGELIDPSGNALTFMGQLLGSITADGTFKGVSVYYIFGLQPQICSS